MKIDIKKIDENKRTPLCELMTKYGSDKGNGHTYTRYYYELFKNIKEQTLNIFEVGLGTNNVNIPSNMGKNGQPGASLRGWKDFFVNSYIYGADVDKDILFEEPRIKTFYCDQLNPETIKTMWNGINLEFDIIVDDGLHTPEANLTFFKNSWEKLKKTGIFIIEDIFECNIKYYEEYFQKENIKYQVVLLNKYNDNNFILVWK